MGINLTIRIVSTMEVWMSSGIFVFDLLELFSLHITHSLIVAGHSIVSRKLSKLSKFQQITDLQLLEWYD